MPSSVFQIRCSPDEKGRWKEAAGTEGMSLAAWLRRLANEEADRVKAEMRAAEDAERERSKIRQTAFPGSMGDSCKHVPQGLWCTQCQRKNW